MKWETLINLSNRGEAFSLSWNIIVGVRERWTERTIRWVSRKRAVKQPSVPSSGDIGKVVNRILPLAPPLLRYQQRMKWRCATARFTALSALFPLCPQAPSSLSSTFKPLRTSELVHAKPLWATFFYKYQRYNYISWIYHNKLCFNSSIFQKYFSSRLE